MGIVDFNFKKLKIFFFTYLVIFLNLILFINDNYWVMGFQII